MDHTDLNMHRWESPKDIYLEVWDSKNVDPKGWVLHIDFIRDLSGSSGGFKSQAGVRE